MVMFAANSFATSTVKHSNTMTFNISSDDGPLAAGSALERKVINGSRNLNPLRGFQCASLGQSPVGGFLLTSQAPQA